MSEDNSAEWAAPPPRDTVTISKKRKAEAIVRLHQITFGNFKGKRVLYCDNVIPPRDYTLLAEAMREGLI